MALDPGRRSASPESSGRDSPVPRQWRNQLSSGKPTSYHMLLCCEGIEAHVAMNKTEEVPPNDKNYRKYAAGVERALSLFETALQEWADYISFLNRLLKVGIGTATLLPSQS